VRLHRKRQELAFGGAAASPRNPRVEEPDNGFQHTIGGVGVALVNPENALIAAEHYRAVRMGQDPLDISETECQKPDCETVLKSGALSRCPAVPLLHSP
jgi:hypothetical protein